jgi:predicted SAM-dependent methyltransferase
MDSFPQETIRTKKTMNKRLDMYLCYTIKNSCKSVKNLYDNSHFKEHLTLEGEIEFEKRRWTCLRINPLIIRFTVRMFRH